MISALITDTRRPRRAKASPPRYGRLSCAEITVRACGSMVRCSFGVGRLAVVDDGQLHGWPPGPDGLRLPGSVLRRCPPNIARVSAPVGRQRCGRPRASSLWRAEPRIDRRLLDRSADRRRRAPGGLGGEPFGAATDRTDDLRQTRRPFAVIAAPSPGSVAGRWTRPSPRPAACSEPDDIVTSNGRYAATRRADVMRVWMRVRLPLRRRRCSSVARTRWATCRIHSRVGGVGPPVVLVHGYGVSGRYLLPLANGPGRPVRHVRPRPARPRPARPDGRCHGHPRPGRRARRLARRRGPVQPGLRRELDGVSDRH